jgi:inner membrane protein
MFSLLCSILPDVDLFSFYFKIPYGSVWGHRGFTHSLFFAFLVSLAVMFLGWKENRPGTLPWWKIWGYFFFLASSHGILDAMTNGGKGVAFFSPFDLTRYFLPWTPLVVTPLRLNTFLTSRAREVLWSEMIWVWLPSILVWGAIRGVSKLTSRIVPRGPKRAEA